MIKPIIPQITLDILREKQKSNKNENYHNGFPSDSLVPEFSILENHKASVSNISNLAKLGILNRSSDVYKVKCASTCFLPFGIALEKGGRIELIAANQESMNTIIFCINFLSDNKK